MLKIEEMEELDWRLELGESGIKVHRGSDAVRNNLDQWLHVPEGTVPDWPSWGNPLHRIKFLPTEEAAIYLEMKLKPKMEREVRGLKIHRILVKSIEVDMIALYIHFGIGDYTTTVNRQVLRGGY